MSIPNQEKGQWKPGASGNPSGRPKGAKNRSTILKKWIETQVEFSDAATGIKGTGTIEDQIALALIGKAIKGDVMAAKEILDSVYGKIRNEEREELGFEIIKPKLPNQDQ
jgi:hypothetical protein